MWIRSQELGAYVHEMERRAADHQLTFETERAFSQWVVRARAHARRVEEGAIPALLKTLLTQGGTCSERARVNSEGVAIARCAGSVAPTVA